MAMKRFESSYVTSQPARRPLKIFSADPMLGRLGSHRITIEIQNEQVRPGPEGSRIQVIDYDGGNDCYYPPVNLNDPALLMQGGLDPSESDPRFHQQMVYAVAMKVIENFDAALGRHLLFKRGRYEKLRLFPHAFHGANAFFEPKLNAILFGYFRADSSDPGPNIPGQTVFTCLSHDIIAHEMTHAIVNRLRRHFIDPSNVDVLAFHEAFSDIVALFQHFTFKEVLREQIQAQRTDLRRADLLVSLAQQFGYATGSGKALRSALGKPDPTQYASAVEPHARGSILVGAVFDGFFEVYQRRIRDLIRIATGGTGNLPDADLHPDLVNRIASEAAGAAQNILKMCIRAFDYLPPVDVTFGDLLRALVTADYELVPDDQHGQRVLMIEAFRKRGIVPQNVTSLAEESLIWKLEDELPDLPPDIVDTLTTAAQSVERSRRLSFKDPPSFGDRYTKQFEITVEEEEDFSKAVAVTLHRYANANRAPLGLHPTLPVQVGGFHNVFRVAPDGQLLIELVAQFVQTDGEKKETWGGLSMRGGSTVIAGSDGRVRYAICKPLPSPDLTPSRRVEAERRRDQQERYVELCDMRDPWVAWADETYMSKRMALRTHLRSVHEGITR